MSLVPAFRNTNRVTQTQITCTYVYVLSKTAKSNFWWSLVIARSPYLCCASNFIRIIIGIDQKLTTLIEVLWTARVFTSNLILWLAFSCTGNIVVFSWARRSEKSNMFWCLNRSFALRIFLLCFWREVRKMTQVNYKNWQPLTEKVNNENCDRIDQVTEIHLFVVLYNVPNTT